MLYTILIQISNAHINRWFDKSDAKRTYASYLSDFTSVDEIAIARQLITNKPLNNTVSWTSSSVYITY
jgi:hypothetical protein